MTDYTTILGNPGSDAAAEAQQAKEKAEQERQELADQQQEVLEQAARKAAKSPDTQPSEDLIKPEDLSFLNSK